jgi:hypothetical protein
MMELHSLTRRVAVVALAALLGACASGPKLAEIKSSIPAVKPGEGRIYVYRDGSMMGAGIQPNVLINGKVVGESKPGGFFFVDLQPGPVVVSTSTEVEKKLTLTLDAGQTRYVRTGGGLRGAGLSRLSGACGRRAREPGIGRDELYREAARQAVIVVCG